MKKSLKIIGAVFILFLLFGCENGQLGTISQISGSGYYAECQQGDSLVSSGSGTGVFTIDTRGFRACHFSTDGVSSDTMTLSTQIIQNGEYIAYTNALGANPWATADSMEYVNLIGIQNVKWERTGVVDGEIIIEYGCETFCR